MNRGSGLLEQLAEAADARIEGQEARLARHLADAVLARTAGGRSREGQALELLTWAPSSSQGAPSTSRA